MLKNNNSIAPKACVVTVYNSENCGSFWQARALQEYLHEKGYQVFFLKRNMKGSSHTITGLTKKIIKALWHRQFNSAFLGVLQYRCFSAETKAFPLVTSCDTSFDICILGSDTIWNIGDRYFLKEKKIYWGETANSKIVISYAASLGNSDISILRNYPELVNDLTRLDGISVRDDHTLNIVKSLTGKNVSLVCDPTLLYDKSFYSNYVGRPKDQNYIFVYYFQRMPVDLERKIVNYAERKNLQIIVMGESMKSFTRREGFDPMLFLNRFANADLVVTNTFHGTLFSVIFEKQAIFNSNWKQKVRDIIERFGISDQDYAGCNSIESLFYNKIDYEVVRDKVDVFRKESKRFLAKYIGDERICQ